MQYQVRLRELNKSRLVNDLFLLEIALKLGAVDEEGDPIFATYRESNKVSDAQLRSMIDGVEDIIKKSRIAPGEAAGLVTAHSISEPITQSVMRTFHYAGVLTKPSALKRLNVDVSMSAPETVALAIALKPPFNKDYQMVREMCHKLGRTRLDRFAHVTMDNFDFIEHKMRQEIEDIEKKIASFEGEKFKKMSKTQFEAKRKKFESIGITLEDDYSNDYTDEYQNLLDQKRTIVQRQIDKAVQAASRNVFTIYMARDSILEPGQLYRAINLQFKEGDGSFRRYGKPPTEQEPNPLHYIFKSAKMVSIDEAEYKGEEVYAIQVDFPGLPRGHFLNFVEQMNNIELCNNCRFPTTLAVLKPVKGKSKPEIVEDDSWDTSAPVDSYYEKVLQSLKESGYKPNPPEDEVEEDSTGLFEIEASEFTRVRFTVGDKHEHKRCGNCDHGWIHFNYKEATITTPDGNTISAPSGNVLPGPLIQKDIYGFPTPLTSPEEYSPLTALNPGDNNFLTADEKPSALFQGRPVVQEDDQFIYPAQGNTPGLSEIGTGLSDYPIQHAEDGMMIAEPQDNEYFILAFITDKSRIGDRKTGYIGQGGWLRTVKTFSDMHGILDFDRTTCSDVRQVENVLGIEAGRTVLFNNLMTTIGDAGETHLKHALLLSDAMCAHNTIMTAPASRGSVAGLNSQMGNRTEFLSDGSMEHYGSVLAQAYERQVEVVLRRSVVGMVDDLKHVKSSAIAGDPGLAKFGTLAGADDGKYSSPSIDEAMRAFADYTMGAPNGKQNLDTLLKERANSGLIEALKEFINSILSRMDEMSLEKTSMTWQTKLFYTPELAAQDKREASILQRQNYQVLMADEQFMELFEHYGIVNELLVYILAFMEIV